MYDQELHVGPDAPGWRGPAITGDRTALGSILVVGDDERFDSVQAGKASDGVAHLPLSRAGQLITAMAHDAPTLRHRLDDAYRRLMDPEPCVPA